MLRMALDSLEQPPGVNNNTFHFPHSYQQQQQFQMSLPSNNNTSQPNLIPQFLSSTGTAVAANATTATTTTAATMPPTTLVDVLLHSPSNSHWTRGLISMHNNNDAIKLVLTPQSTADSPLAPMSAAALNFNSINSNLNDCLPTLPPESVINQPKRLN